MTPSVFSDFAFFIKRTSGMNPINKKIFDQIQTQYEVSAQQTEHCVQIMNLLVDSIDISDLNGDERAALKGWHEGAQRSAKTIREF